MANPKIRYDIEAAIKGGKDADELAKTLRDLGDVLEGDLQQGALGAAQALEALGSKQRALSAFKELSAESRKVGSDLDKASASVDKLGAELGPVTNAARAFAKAEEEARAAVVATQEALAIQQGLLRTTRTESDAATKKTIDYKQSVDGLKAAIAASKKQLEEKRTALTGAATASSQAAKAERVLQKEYGAAVTSAQRLSRELVLKNAALADVRSRMATLGVTTSNLAQQERSLQGAVQQVRQEVERLAPAYQAAASKASAPALQQAAAVRTLRDGVGELGAQLQRIQGIAAAALGGSWLAGKAMEVAAVADEFKNLQARVQLATGEGELFTESWAKVSQTALDTNTSLSSTATLFARITDASKSAGLSAVEASAQALGLTETINQAVQLSGASAQASDAAITQLIQALQSGVLRGEEFNSVMEQAPRLAKALADGLSVTTGELRKMAGEGALTTEVVIKALQGQASVVEQEFGKLPATVGRALENLRTQWTLYVGSSDAGLLSSENAAKAIDYLAQNLDTLVTTLQTAGKLWAAMKIAQLAGDFAAWATKTLTATAAMEANTVATTVNTAAQKANAMAVGASAAALGAQAVAAKAAGVAQAGASSAMQQAGIFAGQAAKAKAGAAAQMLNAARASGFLSTAMTGVRWAARGVTAALGGPVGLVATAVLFHEEIKSGVGAVVEWGMGFTETGRRMKQAEATMRELDAQTKAQKVAAEEAAQAALQHAAAQEAARNASFGLSQQAQAQVAVFEGMIKAGDGVSESLSKIGKDFDLSTQPGIQNAAGVLDRLLADGRITAEQFAEAWNVALRDINLGDFEARARTALQAGARDAERMGQMLDAVVRQAVERTGLDFDVLRGRVGAVSRSAISDVDAIAGSLGRLQVQGVDTGRVLQEALTRAIETADSQQAIEELEKRIVALRNQLGSTEAEGLLDEAKNKAQELGEELEDAIPGIQGVEEAMRQLGVVSDASLKETAEQAKKAYDIVRESGTATPREIALAFEKAADAAEKSADKTIQAWAKVERERLRIQQGNLPELKRTPAPEKMPTEQPYEGSSSQEKGFYKKDEDFSLNQPDKKTENLIQTSSNDEKQIERIKQKEKEDRKKRDEDFYKSWTERTIAEQSESDRAINSPASAPVARDRKGRVIIKSSASDPIPSEARSEEILKLEEAKARSPHHYRKALEEVKWRLIDDENKAARAARNAEYEERNAKKREQVANLDTGPSGRNLLEEYSSGTLQSMFPKGAMTFKMPTFPMASAVGGNSKAPNSPSQIHRHEIAFGGDRVSIETNDQGSADLNKLLVALERGRGMSGF